MNYQEYVEKTVSEKVVLCWIEPKQRLVNWTLHSGAIYKKSVDYYVIDFRYQDTSLTQASSSSLSAGEWFFDYDTKILYIRLLDDSDPNNSFVSVVYRLFFSDSPYILPYDLVSGNNQVEYENYIESTSSFPQEIDSAEQLGIALESNGRIIFNNKDSHFDSIFDILVFENANVTIYSWSPLISVNDKRKIFSGEIENKSFDENAVTFRIKDFVHKLRKPVTLGEFSSSDGNISDDVIGTQKTRIYGRVEGLKVQSLDQVLGGYELTGTLTGTKGGLTVTGSGTSFLSECSPEDNITIGENKYSIETVDSDGQITLTEEIESSFSGETVTNEPTVSYREKNRTFFIAGHKLREPSTTVTSSPQLNRLYLASINDLFAGDLIKIGATYRTIRRISGNLVVLTQNLPSSPSPGTTVTKSPVYSVFFKGNEFEIDRDWNVTNTSTSAKITLTNDAEFNITKPKKSRGTTTFTNSSRDVTGSSTNFTEDFKTRDWIQSNDTNHATWYEILEVIDDTNMKLRIAYAGANIAGTAKKKNVDYIGDDSVVSIDCMGKENSSGEWVKTPSDVVKDLLDEANITNIDIDAFTQSDIEAHYIVSMKLPFQQSPPTIRSIISKINISCFGSLVVTDDFDVAYNILNAEKPEDLTELKDDDILSFSVETSTTIYRKILAYYRHFDVDRYSNEPGKKLTTFDNTFVDYLIGSGNEKEVDLYLFDEADAQTIAQRYGFIHSLTQSIVKIKSSLNLTLKNINDKIFLNLDRLYKRFGGTDSRKIGIVSKISRSGTTTDLSFSDVGNIFNRSATVAPNTASDFSAATEEEKIKNGYIVDNGTEIIDDNEEIINTNIIS